MRVGLAVLSGILLGISFPKFGLGLVSLIGLLPLLWVLHQPGRPPSEALNPRRAFRYGYLTGVSFFLLLLHWIPRLPRENVTIPFAMYPALVIMVAYLALFPAATSALSVWLARRRVPIGYSFPLIWTLLEFLRGWGIFGFPWGSLGYSMAAYPHLIQFAAYTGLWGVTLWVVLVNGMVHRYLASPGATTKAIALGGLLVLVLAPYFHGQHVLKNREPRPGLDVGLIQPNVGNNKWQAGVRDSVIQSLLEQTASFAGELHARPLRLIVWPETAMPTRLPRNPLYRRQVEALVDSIGIPILAGFPDGVRLPDGKTRFTNSAALVVPGEGITQQYDKRHLVPFSEYFPLPVLNRHDFGQSNFSAGERPGVMRGLQIPFGVLICFESIFPGPARDARREGARFLVNITNDQWFGDSAAPYQHFYMNVLRCIENRTGMVRAANTGISGSIDAYGLVVDRTSTFVRTDLVSRVELGKQEMPFYSRHGDWIVLVTLGLLGILGGWALIRGRP